MFVAVTKRYYGILQGHIPIMCYCVVIKPYVALYHENIVLKNKQTTSNLLGTGQVCRSYQKKLTPVPNAVSRRHALNSYEYRCCHFSVATQERAQSKDKITADSVSSTNENALDSFTENLIQKNVNKWKCVKTDRLPAFPSEDRLSCSQHDNLTLQSAAETLTLDHETRTDEKERCCHCVLLPQQKCLPGSDPLLVNLNNCSFHEECKKKVYNLNLGKLTWKKGHIEDALQLFWDMYTENCVMRQKIKSILIALMAVTLVKKGEAVMILIINFSKKVVDVHGDYTFLAYVWEYCLLSNWFSDNKIAVSLLEEYPELKITIKSRLHQITSVAIAAHNISVLQRLFEILLKYEMKTECELVLRSLFDYACSIRDLYSCSAIVQSCCDLDVTLTTEQNSRFLQLFCQQDIPEKMKRGLRIWNTKPSKFTLKF